MPLVRSELRVQRLCTPLSVNIDFHIRGRAVFNLDSNGNQLLTVRALMAIRRSTERRKGDPPKSLGFLTLQFASRTENRFRSFVSPKRNVNSNAKLLIRRGTINSKPMFIGFNLFFNSCVHENYASISRRRRVDLAEYGARIEK